MAYLIDNHSANINKIGSYESLKGLATFKAFPYVYYLLCITICQVLSPVSISTILWNSSGTSYPLDDALSVIANEGKK